MTTPIKYRISSTATKPVSDTVKGAPLTSLEIDGNFRSIKDSVELIQRAYLPAGYNAPVEYVAGVILSSATQTVAYQGEVYAPKAAEVPFTTSGTFEVTKFVQIQSVASVDLAATDGASLVGYDGGTVQDVLDAVTGPSGAASIGYTPAGTGAVATAVQEVLRETVSVFRFMTPAQIAAVQAGTSTDDTAAIQAAITYVNSKGGGVLLFPAGTYKLATVASDGHILSHFNLTDMEDISFIGYGVTLQSTYSTAVIENAGALFNCNGVRRISFEGFDISGMFARSLSVVSDYSIGAFYLASSDRDGESISVRNIRAQGVYFFIRTRQPGVSGYRVRNILTENCLAVNGYYGLNFQQNGDNFSAINFRSYGFIRSYFTYGVDTHNVQYASYNGDVFSDCLIKAYAFDTKNITVNARIIGNTSNDAKCSIESQHAPSTQPIPARLINITVNFDDSNSSGAKSLRFAYFQDTPSPTEPGTSAYNLFDNVVISGYARQAFDVAVTQQVSGRLDVDNLIPALPSSSLFTGKGFVRMQESGTWTPVLVDDSLNPSEGQTASLAIGRYEKVGNVVHFNGRLHMSSLGTLNNTASAAIVGLPYASNPQSSLNTAVVFGQAANLNMSPAGAVTGAIPENTTRINLRKWSSATGTVGLAVSEVTASGQLIFSGSYIV